MEMEILTEQFRNLKLLPFIENDDELWALQNSARLINEWEPIIEFGNKPSWDPYQSARVLQRFWRKKQRAKYAHEINTLLQEIYCFWQDVPFSKYTRKEGYMNGKFNNTDECDCGVESKIIYMHPFYGSLCHRCLKLSGFRTPRGRPNKTSEDYVNNILSSLSK